MKRKDFQNYIWYPVTDETYWVEEYPEEFPNCQTIVICTDPYLFAGGILTRSNCFIGWGTMSKYHKWKFMIIEKPKTTI